MNTISKSYALRVINKSILPKSSLPYVHIHRRTQHNHAASLIISPEIRDAVRSKTPVVALETTIYTHGWSYPANLDLALRLSRLVRTHGAIPATVGVLDGVARVGMTREEIEALVRSKDALKVSRRDLALATAKNNEPRLNGGTTIAATALLSHLAGIRVFATGGLGGVHRDGQDSLDISADLTELGRTPVAVIAGGCKGFLDIPRTLEVLETQGVCVATFADGQGEGEKVDFPAFWSRESGVKSPSVLRDEGHAAGVIYAQKEMGIESGMFFANPVPEEASIPRKELEKMIETAIQAADEAGATGSANTPFILNEIKRLSNGRSVAANNALVEANIVRGAKVAVELSKLERGEYQGASYQPAIIQKHKAKEPEEAFSPNTKKSTEMTNEEKQITKPIDVLVAGSVAIDLSCDYKANSASSKLLNPSLHTSNPASISSSIGGVGFNVTNSVLKTGAKVQLCSMIADDIAGQTILNHMENLGFDTGGIVKTKNKRVSTAQYVAFNDSNKDLFVAMADMGVVEHNHEQNFTESLNPWLPYVRSLRESPKNHPKQLKWLILDANWDSKTLHMWIDTARAGNIATAFEPVSVAKSGRLFEHAINYNLPRIVDLATPNVLELIAMHEKVQQTGLMERPDWWKTIDALGIPASGARTELVRATSNELVDQGIPQRSIQLLPFIPNLLTTLGSRGVLLTKILLADDKALGDSRSNAYIISRSKIEGPVGGLYMRLFPTLETLDKSVIKSVNGAGDAFFGTLVGLLAQATDPVIEDVINQAQTASLNVLKAERAST